MAILEIVFSNIWNLVLVSTIGVLVAWFGRKMESYLDYRHDLKLAENAESCVKKAVDFVEQTYVRKTKQEGKWDSSTMTIAFVKCEEVSRRLIGARTKQAIESTGVDYDVWLKATIEDVIDEKKSKF